MNPYYKIIWLVFRILIPLIIMILIIRVNHQKKLSMMDDEDTEET